MELRCYGGERNDHIGLCNISEEGLEQGHKLIREFSTCLSRKSDPFLGLSDVAMRLFVYGCPVLNENFRKILVCSLCGKVGHQKIAEKTRRRILKMCPQTTNRIHRLPLIS